ncbi:MAG: hypothetical protein AB7F88_18150 [Pyrinomonadaceae bacterium]
MASRRQFTFSKRTHTAMAIVFLFVMLVEWGSHNLAFAHGGPGAELVTVASGAVGHDDPCPTMICCDVPKHEQKTTTSSHYVSPCTPSAERTRETLRLDRTMKSPPLRRDDANGISRPKDPLFHPPEFSSIFA